MKIQDPVYKGKFIKRYKRFFADIEFEDEIITALVPNTGSLKTCLNEGSECYFTTHDDPKRKLKYTLQMLKTPDSWVGINTHFPNFLAFELWEKTPLKHWKKYDQAQKEIKINTKSRLDLVLWKNSDQFSQTKIKTEHIEQHQFHFVEVKNVTMVKDEIALFPDSVTTRGQKHILELMELMEKGHSCELLFVVQRDDAKGFAPASEIDPEYARLLNEARHKGLTITPIVCDISKTKLSLNPKKILPLKF